MSCYVGPRLTVKNEHEDGIKTFGFGDGSWTVSHNDVWINGIYASEEAALMAPYIDVDILNAAWIDETPTPMSLDTLGLLMCKTKRKEVLTAAREYAESQVVVPRRTPGLLEEMEVAGWEAADRANQAEVKYGRYNSLHEAYAVLKEEVDEFWDIVKMKQKDRNPEDVIDELLDVAGVAVRVIAQIRQENEWISK